MAQRCVVAGHIAGVVQERPNVAVSDHEDHPSACRPVTADHFASIEEADLPPMKPAQTPNTAGSQCAQVPVDLS